MELEIRNCENQDLNDIFNIRSSYIDMSKENFVNSARLNADLWFVVFDDNILIGYCLGLKCKNNPSYIVIDEIVTNLSSDSKYTRRGIGTKLIKQFEEEAWKQGFKTIGFGCSDNYKVEKFYLKNGYIPIEVVINKNGQELERIKIPNYETGKIIQAELRSKYNAKEVNFVFEKYIYRS